MTGGIGNTFVFADLAGFTALTEAHGDIAAADLVAGFCELAREELTAHDAEEVKTLGDAVLLRAARPEAAISLGVALAERVSSAPRMPELRVGMHTGSAVERSGDWFGSAVNLAARVTAAAGGGEVLLTESTREGAGDLDGIELEALGSHSFRNVPERVAIFRALPRRARPPSAIDPVCRMRVDPSRSAGSLDFGGTTFRFCSLECAAAFAADPESFIQDREAGRVS